MGIMNRLLGGKNEGDRPSNSSQLATDGNHSIDAAKVHRPTDPTVYSPVNPGSLNSIRTAPVVPQPRYFTREEANALGELARQKQSEAKAAKRAYKHLKTLEESDAEVHKRHYSYAKKVASKELNKLQSTNAYAKYLHRLRPGYAAMGTELSQADNKATNAIASIKAKYEEGNP